MLVKEYNQFLPEEKPIDFSPVLPTPVNSVLGLVFPITFTLKNTEPQTPGNGSIIFIAHFPCEIVSAIELHDIAAATSTTYTLSIVKDTGTGALGSGNAVLTGTFDLMATARTKQILQATTTKTDRVMDKGDRLTAKLAYTGSAPTAIKDMNVTIFVKLITQSLNAATS